MTKKRTAVSSARATKPSTPETRAAYNKSLLDYIHKMKRMSHAPKVLLVLFIFSLLLMDAIITGTAGSLAMLYMLAENGKKSGRADGNVYMRNGRIRGMAIPANPSTSFQSTQRGNFGSLSSAWNALTAAQQAAWNAFSIQDTDRFGREIIISGKQAYVALNRNLFNTGDTAIDEPPLPVGVASPTSLTLTAATTPSDSVSLAFTPTPIPANINFLVYATRGLSAGTFSPSKSEYRLIDSLAPAATSPQVITAAYTARFGSLVAGTKIFVKVVAVSATSGIASAPVYTSDIVA